MTVSGCPDSTQPGHSRWGRHQRRRTKTPIIPPRIGDLLRNGSRGRVSILCATGSTIRTALRAIGRAGAGKIVLAVPVAPEDALEELRKEVDEIICLSTPSPFLAVGAHYAEFGQLADADVISLLEERHRRMARSGARPSG